MMLEFPLRLHPCRLCHGNSDILDRGSFRSDATLFFIYFFPKQTVPQRLAKLLWLWICGEERRKRVRTRRSSAQPFKVRITPFQMSKGIMALSSPIYLAVIPVFMTDANESF